MEPSEYGLLAKKHREAAEWHLRQAEIAEFQDVMSTKGEAEQARALFRYEPETGEFYWRVKRGHSNPGDKAGSARGAYKTIHFNGRNVYAHRLAWLYVHGVWPSDLIDHIDRDKFNNRLANLREATRAENAHNTESYEGKGVYIRPDSKKWYARIRVCNERHQFGPFDDRELAVLVRDEAVRKFHPFACGGGRTQAKAWEAKA